MLKYSIIIPVYNIKEYLADCLDSVLAQSFSDYEVILVNDGSTDGSDTLCNAYAAQHPQIHVVHQPNQGVSVARNTGLEHAQGKYVLFLDSDDWWEQNLLELLTPFINKNCDLVEFGYQAIVDHAPPKTVCPQIFCSNLRGADYLQQVFCKMEIPIGSCWCCAYRRQLLMDQNLRFPVGVRYGEDLKFRIAVLEKATSVYTISEAPYCYRIRSSSVTNALSAPAFSDVLSVSSELCRNYPLAVTANYYCMNLLAVASLTRKEAKLLNPLFRKNRSLMKLATDKRARIARILFSVFGWYFSAKLIRFFVSVRQRS